MKSLNKLIISLLLLLVGTVVNAQSFGIKAGLNLSKIFQRNHPATYSFPHNMNPGFHVGSIVEVPVKRFFTVESGLMLTTKGTRAKEKSRYIEKSSYVNGTSEYKTVLNSFYLDVPIKAKAIFEIGGLKVYGAFGPYAGMGLSGKLKNSFTINEETEIIVEDVRFGSDENEDDLQRLDFGLTGGTGIQLNSFQFGMDYSLGLANIATNKANGHNIKNRVLGISLSYLFGLY